jgi:hypothetical protein
MGQQKDRYIWIPKSLLLSPAYLSLSATAMKVFAILCTKRQVANMNEGKKGKRKRWVCTNNGQLIFTYKEAREVYGFHYSVFSRAIDELIAKGFLRITRLGGKTWEGNTPEDLPTLYELDDRWQEYGTAQFRVEERIKRRTYAFPKKSEFATTSNSSGVTTTCSSDSP